MGLGEGGGAPRVGGQLTRPSAPQDNPKELKFLFDTLRRVEKLQTVKDLTQSEAKVIRSNLSGILAPATAAELQSTGVDVREPRPRPARRFVYVLRSDPAAARANANGRAPRTTRARSTVVWREPRGCCAVTLDCTPSAQPRRASMRSRTGSSVRRAKTTAGSQNKRGSGVGPRMSGSVAQNRRRSGAAHSGRGQRTTSADVRLPAIEKESAWASKTVRAINPSARGPTLRGTTARGLVPKQTTQSVPMLSGTCSACPYRVLWNQLP